jgi:opacity protein-like surface antigen
MMMKLKFVAAAVALATVMAGPASARVVHHRGHYHHYHRGVGPIGAAAGLAGLAIGTAGAIATAPFRDPYYDRGYGYYDRGYAGPYYERRYYQDRW